MPLSFRKTSLNAKRRTRRRIFWLAIFVLISVILLVFRWVLPPGFEPFTSLTPTTSHTLEPSQGVVQQASSETRTPTLPQPSATLPATPTAASTTPSPTDTPVPSTPSPQPRRVSPLLFLTEERLGSWDHESGELSLVAQQVVDYSVNSNGRKIAILQRQGITNNSSFRLVLFDQETGRKHVLVEETDELFNLAISPNGQWVAYTSQEQGGTIFTRSVEVPASEYELGFCIMEEALICSALPVWTPDSSSLFWADSRGLWHSESNGRTGGQILTNQIQLQDPRGQMVEHQVYYQDLLPSPLSRYWVVQVSPLNSEVSWQALIDTRLVRMVELLSTYYLENSTGRVGWASDGRLIEVITPSQTNLSDDQQIYLNIQVWRVLPTRDDLMLPLFHEQFPDEDLQIDGPPAWIGPFGEGDVAFAILSSDQGGQADLYQFGLRSRILLQINQLPFIPQAIHWSPDGSGAVAISPDGEPFYAPSDGSPPTNLQDILGEDAGDFLWLPPGSLLK